MIEPISEVENQTKRVVVHSTTVGGGRVAANINK